MTAECTRHGFTHEPTNNPHQPYYVERCSHIGSRFVVQIRSQFSGFVMVDYVEDVPGGDMVIEAHEPTDADATWDWLNQRMADGDPPKQVEL